MSDRDQIPPAITRPHALSVQAERRRQDGGLDAGSRRSSLARRALLGGLALGAVLAAPAQAAGWEAYVPAPKTATPEPVRIFKVIGDVQNPEALVEGGTGTTKLTSPADGPKATVVLDFGQVVGGTPEVAVAASVPSAPGVPALAQGWSEASSFVLTEAGDPAVDQPLTGFPTTQPAAPGTVVGPPIGGFRYYALQVTSGSVELSDVKLRFGAYRATADKYQGHFLSSSDYMNRLWYAGAYTAHMNMWPAGSAGTSATTFPIVQRTNSVLDGAKRDRALWSGDLLLTDAIIWQSLGTNGDPYVKTSLQRFLDAQQDNGRFHSVLDFPFVGINFNYANTYSAYLAEAVIDYYRRSGDRPFIEAALPRLERATAYHATLLNENGLIVSNDNDYWQTQQTGEVTEYSLVYIELLQQMSWLERSLGRETQAADYDARAAKVAEAINARLWNAEAGAYQQSDTSKTIVLDANANAIRHGVAPPERIPSILKVLRQGWTPYGARISPTDPKVADPGGHEIEPLNNAWELEARLKTGDDDGALELLHRLYDQQLDPANPAHTGTMWEFMDDDGEVKTGFVSLAHGWGGGGTFLLTEYVLGVRPTGPGYRTFDVDPHPLGLRFAEGVVPTPNGPIAVRWDRDGDQLLMRVTVPQGTTARLPREGRTLGPGTHEVRRTSAVPATPPAASPSSAGTSQSGPAPAPRPGADTAGRPCASRRRLTVTLRAPREFRARVATVRVGRVVRRVRVARRGRLLRVPVVLAGRRRSTTTVRITVRDTRGRTVRTTRRYRLCVPR